ncbi:MAG: hypothetical protein V1754_15355 [Pseudomonadota bacterium]
MSKTPKLVPRFSLMLLLHLSAVFLLALSQRAYADLPSEFVSNSTPEQAGAVVKNIGKGVPSDQIINLDTIDGTTGSTVPSSTSEQSSGLPASNSGELISLEALVAKIDGQGGLVNWANQNPDVATRAFNEYSQPRYAQQIESLISGNSSAQMAQSFPGQAQAQLQSQIGRLQNSALQQQVQSFVWQVLWPQK